MARTWKKALRGPFRYRPAAVKTGFGGKAILWPMITPENYLRTPAPSEGREVRDLRKYARTELDSGIACLARECNGNKVSGKKKPTPFVAWILKSARKESLCKEAADSIGSPASTQI